MFLSFRFTDRESGFTTLKRVFSHEVATNFLASKMETLLDAIRSGIKRNSNENEARLACEFSTLFFINIQLTDENLFKEFSNLFRDIILHEIDPSLQIAALRALAICSYFLTDDPYSSRDCCLFFEDLFSKQMSDLLPEVVNEAMIQWGAAAAQLPTSIFLEISLRVTPLFKKLLRSDNIEWRMACGENLALIIEVLREERLVDDDTSDDSFDNEDALHAVMSNGDLNNLNELSEQFEHLSTRPTRGFSKKNRARQRSAFREIVRSVQNGELPNEKLAFGVEEIAFTGWREIKQLNLVRTILGEGLHIHFQFNNSIRHLFGFQPVEAPFFFDDERIIKLTPGQREHARSESILASKQRSRWLTKQRQKRMMVSELYS